MAAVYRPPACLGCSLRPCKCNMIDAAINETVGRADTEEKDCSSDDFDIVDNNKPKGVISDQQDPVRVRVVRARRDTT
jgi:hypothetical protein